MTELLKDLMAERAETADFSAPDLDAIMHDGDRRVRRSRTGGGLAAVAAVGVLAVAMPLAGGGLVSGDSGDTSVAGAPPSTATWSVGSVIHSGDRTIDVGREIRAFVATETGYVYIAPEGQVFATTKDGETSEQVGRTDEDHQRLVVDGDRVIWVNPTGDGKSGFTVLDHATGEISSLGPEGRGMSVSALDGTTLWGTMADEAVSIDLDTGERTILGFGGIGDGPEMPTIYDAEQEQVVHDDIADDGSSDGIVISDGYAPEGATFPLWGGDLSPSTTYVMSENSDDFKVVETATGEERTPEAKSDYAFFTGAYWLDDDTYVALGMSKETEPIDLLTCEAASGECEVTEQDAGIVPDLQLPIGQRIGD